MSKNSKSVQQIMIERFLKQVKESGELPWQRPFEFGLPVNYVTQKTYRGINRLILPTGEYLTKTQINEYNAKHDEDYKFQKGIEWFPVCYYKDGWKRVSDTNIIDNLNKITNKIGESVLYEFKKYALTYEGWMQHYTILKYFTVAERKHFKNSRGEVLPSRRSEGGRRFADYTNTSEIAESVINNYVESSGVKITRLDNGAYYLPNDDTVNIPKNFISSEMYYQVFFHELAHSTGHQRRLNRLHGAAFGSQPYAKEELIAEICSGLLCAESGIHTFGLKESEGYENSKAYVQMWIKLIKDWENEFLKICTSAVNACEYILGEGD